MGAITEILPFRPPNSCERNICLKNADFCSEHLPGVYRYLGAWCGNGYTCSDCYVVPPYGAIRCVCEQPPFVTSAAYGQSCGLNAACTAGECYRPCSTFLFKSDCPTDRCEWIVSSRACLDVSVKPSLSVWTVVAPYDLGKPSEAQRGTLIVSATNDACLNVTDPGALKTASEGYFVRGQTRLSDIVSVDKLFLLLDRDTDGSITKDEFSHLPQVLTDISNLVPVAANRRLDATSLVPPLTGADVEQCLTITDSSPPSLVSACASPDLQGTICNADGSKYYCLIDKTCKSSCSGCSWLNAEDMTSHRCIPASAQSCKAMTKMYCASDKSCHAFNDCSACTNLVHADTQSYLCVAAWWGNTVSDDPSQWICRDRKSAAMTCRSDMDCIYGARKCVASVCEPISGGGSSLCASNRDCMVGFFCPSDPTGGQDPFYVQSCKPLREPGEVCSSNSDCVGTAGCENGTCISFFSLPVGEAVSDPFLCTSGQVGRDRTCATPFKSLRVGQSCVTDDDCPSSDVAGFVAECRCVNWWDDGTTACRRCMPLVGDFDNRAESLRRYLYMRGVLCSPSWKQSECHREKTSVGELWKAYKCEEQKLFGGLTPVPEGCSDDQFIDYCV